MKNKLFALWVSLVFLCLNSSYTLNAQCNAPGHSTNEKDSWLSCQTSTNPNTIRGDSHWLQYDLGYVYELGATTFWNYNVANFTNKGFKQIAIDYSLDGVDWKDAGTFQLPEAEGDAGYEGTPGLDLTGITARYVLITALSNWNNGTCAGLSEVRFDVHKSTSDCGDYILTEKVEGNPINAGTYYADTPIQADGSVKAGSSVTIQSAESITLEEGFIAEAGSELVAKIENCNAMEEQNEPIYSKQTATPTDLTIRPQAAIKVFPNPTVNLLNIEFEDLVITDLMIITVSGHEILRRTKGQNLHQIDVSQLPAGIYLVNLLTADQRLIARRFIKAGL